jgi:hypothetical protein
MRGLESGQFGIGFNFVAYAVIFDILHQPVIRIVNVIVRIAADKVAIDGPHLHIGMIVIEMISHGGRHCVEREAALFLMMVVVMVRASAAQQTDRQKQREWFGIKHGTASIQCRASVSGTVIDGN